MEVLCLKQEQLLQSQPFHPMAVSSLHNKPELVVPLENIDLHAVNCAVTTAVNDLGNLVPYACMIASRLL